MTLNVLITGANSGFGLLTARKFAEAGHTVHATLRNPAKGAGLEALKAAGLPVVLVPLDVTDPASIGAAVTAVSKAAPIDVLVNNAGFELRGPVEQLTDELLARQFSTNVLGVVRMVRAVAPGDASAGFRHDHQPVVGGRRGHRAVLGRLLGQQARRGVPLGGSVVRTEAVRRARGDHRAGRLPD